MRRPAVLAGLTTSDPSFLASMADSVKLAVEAIAAERGPSTEDWAKAESLLPVFRDPDIELLLLLARAESREALYGLMYNLVYTLAVLAHQRGGVRLFGCHFEVVDTECQATLPSLASSERSPSRWN
jgi:hypothetical protein